MSVFITLWGARRERPTRSMITPLSSICWNGEHFKLGELRFHAITEYQLQAFCQVRGIVGLVRFWRQSVVL